MLKVILAPPLLLIGCAICGLSGAVLCQLSYSVSPEYFHHSVFPDRDLAPYLHNRFGAAVVGWSGTSGFGACTGVPLLAFGLVLSGWRAYLTHSMAAFSVVALTVLSCGLGGSLYARVTVSDATDCWYDMPDEVVDRVAYERVRVMHDYGGMGGVLGFFTGTAYLLLAGAWQSGSGTRPKSPASGDELRRGASTPAAPAAGPRWMSR
jgi:MFS family permease